MAITGGGQNVSSEGVIVGFDSEQSFERNAKAMRFVEEWLMGGYNDGEEVPIHAPADDKLEVLITDDIDSDGYYTGEITWFDDEIEDWVNGDEVRVFGLNEETLEVDSRYLGRVVGYVSGPVVAVTVGGGGGGGAKVGVLDEILSAARGSEADMSVYANGIDTGDTLVVKNWLGCMLPAGAYVIVVHDADDDKWYVTDSIFRPNIKGKLDGTLSFGGSATVSVWANTGSGELDTTENVTGYDWCLSTGQALTSGTQVWLSWDANSHRYYVTSSQGCG